MIFGNYKIVFLVQCMERFKKNHCNKIHFPFQDGYNFLLRGDALCQVVLFMKQRTKMQPTLCTR